MYKSESYMNEESYLRKLGSSTSTTTHILNWLQVKVPFLKGGLQLLAFDNKYRACYILEKRKPRSIERIDIHLINEQIV